MIKKYLIIENNKIKNMIKADDDWIISSNLQHAEFDFDKHHHADIGDNWDENLTYPEKQINIQDILNTLPEISAYQLRRQLSDMGLRDAVEQAVESSNQETKDGYEYATSIKYTDPLVQMFIQGFGLSDQDVITLFSEASQIV